MKTSYLSLITLFFSFTCLAQTDSLNQRIFLVGDAGELRGSTQPVIDWLTKNVDWDNDKNTIIYLGDNIYPLGMPMQGEPSYKESKRIIDYQINLVKGKKAKAFFVPGNHDWKNGKLGGWEQVSHEEDYINSRGLKNVQAWPIYGCPGPEAIELSDKVVLALMDSQWWLDVHEKPGLESSCDTKSEDEIISSLKEIADAHPDQLLIVAMHHPLYSHGVHGGDYTWKHHIFPLTEYFPHLYIPLPILGSIYPITRGIFGNLQDTKHPLYRSMAKQIEAVLKTHAYTIHVAGHDHGLQMLMKDSIPYIVSGSGSNLSRVTKGKYTLFDDADFGFAVIEVRKSGKASVMFYNLKSADMSKPTFTTQLKTIVPIVEKPSLDSIGKLPDSIVVVGNAHLKGSPVKNFILGKNYRKEWTQHIKVPVLDIGTEMGGLTPTKKGGGKETKSLRLVEKDGKEWVLRSVAKYPGAAIPADLRNTFAEDIVEDGISASYPYAALSISPLALAEGVPNIRRKLMYVPDDPRLQRFRADFKNTLAVLEEREPADVKNTYNTEELVLRLAKDNDDHVNQKDVLKARLVDNFIMDYDRHEDQWRWATYDTGKGKMYYAIPRDHDQAFFVNQGLLPGLIKSPWLVPEFQGFKKKADNINTFNRPARNFDRTFLTELSADDWNKAIDTFLNKMTDSVIVASLMNQPAEIHKYSVPKIIQILKDKRKYFRQDMMEYYRFISKVVSIVGSNKKEQFTITKNNDGSVRVVINKIDKDENVSSKIYDRLFDPKVTKELRLYGLEGDDKFVVQGGSSPIKIRMIGGPGDDQFINEGTGGKDIVYDVTFEDNTISGNKGFTQHITSDPQNNRYDRIAYKYNILHPSATVEYNIDDGLYLGAALEYTKQGFQKYPYSMRQYFRGTRALKTNSYHFVYDADYTDAIGHNDLLVRSDFRAPVNVTNFFGIGNNTTKTLDQPGGIKYYRARYNFIDASVLLRKQLQSWMKVSYGAAFQNTRLEPDENIGKFVTNPSVNGLDPTNLYKSKSYFGAEVNLDINSKNNQVLPTRGFVLNAGVRPLFGLNGSSNNIVQLKWDMRIFVSKATPDLTRLVFATRFGANHNIGNYEFTQAQYLSGTDNLRGYRKQRFAGRSMFFNNSEIRYKLLSFTTYLFPGTFGFQVFNDVGRVWADGEHSNRWHDGYGVGLWLAPVQRFVVTASIAHSEEEKALPLLTFGFEF